MTELGQVYRCNICSNTVKVIRAGAGELVCCGQPMELQTKEESEKNQP
jgi:superoxide reductase